MVRSALSARLRTMLPIASRTTRPNRALILRDAARSQVYAGYVNLPAWPLLRMRFCIRVASSPRGAVLFVLRLDLLARRGPVGIGPIAQLIEVAACRQRLAAVPRDGLAVAPGAGG